MAVTGPSFVVVFALSAWKFEWQFGVVVFWFRKIERKKEFLLRKFVWAWIVNAREVFGHV